MKLWVSYSDYVYGKHLYALDVEQPMTVAEIRRYVREKVPAHDFYTIDALLVSSEDGALLNDDTLVTDTTGAIHVRPVIPAEIDAFLGRFTTTFRDLAFYLRDAAYEYADSEDDFGYRRFAPNFQHDALAALSTVAFDRMKQSLPELADTQSALFRFYRDLVFATYLRALRREHFAYFAAPDQRRINAQALRIPVMVGGAVVLGAVLAAIDPAQSIAVGGAAGLVSLLLNLLANWTGRSEYCLDRDAVEHLLKEDYSPTRAALLWAFLKADAPVSVREIVAIAPISATALRSNLQALAKAGIVEIATVKGERPRRWHLRKTA